MNQKRKNNWCAIALPILAVLAAEFFIIKRFAPRTDTGINMDSSSWVMDAQAEIISLRCQDSVLQLQAWMGAEIGNTGSAKAYAVLTDENEGSITASAELMSDETLRVDGIEDQQKNGNYYSCEISLSEIQSGCYGLTFLRSYSGSKDIHAAKMSEIIAYDSELNTAGFLSVEIEKENLEKSGEARTDFVPVYYTPWSIMGNRFVVMTGWITVPELESSMSEVYLLIADTAGKTRIYTTEPYKNEYMANELGLAETDCGFYRAIIPIEEIPTGEFELEVAVQYPGALCKTGTKDVMHIRDLD